MQVTLTKCKGVLYPMCALYDSRKGTQERRGLEEEDKTMGYSISKVLYLHIYNCERNKNLKTDHVSAKIVHM